ncbi:2,3-diaminopropionate biosynthesis protein SbnA [Sphingobacterium griseoflavum]|uniref:N-(2-amino-2-carboxyethyl)-L-glutamate synthase n=1 Tax=Sphingobacterium griseoflavum TaxID=1474952 RepID=A0ABQ3I3B1_9SPHI|nr:2,3-diaminopropionate biosynthesis protein SbnA [Sphingobacterium griseoflavum]GHE45628.1 putative siderophore biosynthesis protein SbnA [Sphingobacterium griseoflavum]
MQLTEIKQHAAHILDCIGNTPLVKFDRLFEPSSLAIFGKMELLNPGGSIKDRSALHVVRQAIERGTITKGTVLIESTSGNMGIGLARICHHYNLRLFLVTDPHINPLAEKILSTFGAKIIKVNQHDGNGGYLNTRLKMVKQLLQEIPDSFWPDQYHNLDSPAAHKQTFAEIVHDLGMPPDYLFVPTSTCGTLRGFADAIDAHGAHSKIIAVDAEGSLIFRDSAKPRLIPGMGASRKSHFLKMEQVHDVVHVSDEECIAGCQLLLERESVLAGGSSGAVVKAMQQYQHLLPPDATVVALIPDNGERYLDTIYSDEWINKHFPALP